MTTHCLPEFYLDVDEDKEKVLADVRAALAEMQEFLDLGECTITESETETRTGSTTGNSISNSSMWTTF